MNLLPYKTFNVDASKSREDIRNSINQWMEESTEFNGQWRRDFECDLWHSSRSLFQPAIRGEIIASGETNSKVLVSLAPGSISLLLMVAFSGFLFLMVFDRNSIRVLITASLCLGSIAVFLFATCSKRIDRLETELKSQLQDALGYHKEDRSGKDD